MLSPSELGKKAIGEFLLFKIKELYSVLGRRELTPAATKKGGRPLSHPPSEEMLDALRHHCLTLPHHHARALLGLWSGYGMRPIRHYNSLRIVPICLMIQMTRAPLPRLGR